jgi:hypothetical protein
MPATPRSIWAVPSYLPYLQPPLSPETIAEAEQQIGYHLPDSYLELLRIQNGGYIRYSLADTPHDVICGIGPHFPSLTDFDWSAYRSDVSYELDGLVPFDGDGHWNLCLDYRRKSMSPSITYIDVECDSETHIAASFAEYLQLLRIEDDGDDFVVSEIDDIEVFKRKLGDQMGVEFEAPDLWAHGYPTHRAPGGIEGSHEWLWISPNLVASGFVRSEDERYEELKHLMEGDALRYPELPEDSYIITATSRLHKALLQACNALTINIRPFSDYIETQ